MLVPALAGLARMPARTDPDTALATAQEAHRLATPSLRPFAWTALGWVALARGDRVRAAEAAAASVDSSRRLRAFDLLADALELSAECASESQDAVVPR